MGRIMCSPRFLLLTSLAIATLSGGVILGLRGFESEPGQLKAIPNALEFSEESRSSRRLTVTLENTGGRAVTIKSVKTGCGCTNAMLPEQRIIPPGGSQRILVDVQPPSYGTKETFIAIESDGIALPRIPVRLYGRKLTPPYVRKAPTELRHAFGISEAPRLEFQVTCIEPPSHTNWLAGFNVSCSDIAINGPLAVTTDSISAEAVQRHYRFALEWNGPEAASQPLTASLMPRTTSEPTRPLTMIPVHLRMEPAIRAIPSTLVLSRGNSEGDRQRRVLLQSATDAEWTITAARANAQWLTVKLVEPASSKTDTRSVEIALNDETVTLTSESATVEIETNHPHCPLVSMRVLVAGAAPDGQ